MSRGLKTNTKPKKNWTVWSSNGMKLKVPVMRDTGFTHSTSKEMHVVEVSLFLFWGLSAVSWGLLVSLSPPADGSLCAVRGGVCWSGKAEESNLGGAFPGSCCGAYPVGPGDVHCVGGGHGRIPQGQQDPAAHGRVEEEDELGNDCRFLFLIQRYRLSLHFIFL